MFAVKFTNLFNGREHYTHARDFEDAWDILRTEVRDSAWTLGEDYDAEVVEVDDDFDFEDQPDWN